MGAHVTDAEIRYLDALVERALCSLVETGLPAQPKELALEDVSWANVACSRIDRIAIEPDGTLQLEAPPPDPSALNVSPTAWRPECFRATVVGHGSLVIEQGASALRRAAWGTSGADIVCGVTGWRWHTYLEKSDPVLWVAPVRFMTDGEPVTLSRRHGNMLLAARSSLVRGWRFSIQGGEAFLVPCNGAWYLALGIESPNRLEPHVVQLIAGAIGLALGEPFDLGLWRPFGDAGVLPGIVHLAMPRHASPKASRQPPALPFDCPPTWMAMFVDATVRFAAEHPDAPVLKSIHLYFASLTGYIESKFLHAWIALESMAKWGVNNGGVQDARQRRIADHEAWFRWVASRRTEIEALAVPGMEQRLLSRVQSSENDRPTVVQGALMGLGIEWTPAMDEAEKTRHGVTHEATMSAEGRNWNRDRSQIGLVKTMLIALFARIVGYYGPIADRSQTCFALADKHEPDWWRPIGPFRWIDYRGRSVDQTLSRLVDSTSDS